MPVPGPDVVYFWPSVGNVLVSHNRPCSDPVIVSQYRAISGPVPAQLWATSGLPVPAHYWTDEQKCTGPDQAASTGPVELFSMTSYGPALAHMEKVYWEAKLRLCSVIITEDSLFGCVCPSDGVYS